MPRSSVSSRRDLLDVALGEAPADTCIRGGRLVNVSTGEIYLADVAIKGDRIAAVGDVDYTLGPASTCVDADGRYLVPGLVETHIHCFHSYLGIDEYVRVMLSHGVTAIADDFYGPGVVGGSDAVRFFKKAFDATPIRLIFLVPTIAYLQNRYIGLTPAAGISVEDMHEMLEWEGCRGLSETPFSAVIQKYPEILDLFDAALSQSKVVTGHAAGIEPRELQAYVAMGAYTDHESGGGDDGLAKARSGMKLLSRQGSVSKNLVELARLFTEHGIDTRVSAFSTDVASPDVLTAAGAIDEHVRVAIANGVPPIRAIQMATINGAEIFGLQHDIGSISPGRFADILLVDSLVDFAIDSVLFGGRPMLTHGEFVGALPGTRYPPEHYGTIRLQTRLSADDLMLRSPSDAVSVRVMAIREGTIESTEMEATLHPDGGQLRADVAADVLHLAMADRLGKGTGIGLGFIRGFGLEAGAIASSLTSECCNLCAVGASAEDMAIAMNYVADAGGGVAVVRDEAVQAAVELPVLGMLSDEPLPLAMEKFTSVFAAISALGCPLTSPLSQLEFCFAGGLDPGLKLSDDGLIRVVGSTVTRLDPIIADSDRAPRGVALTG